MGKRHIPESHSAHPNVTPLIDIIMCLIIFFMLVAKIGVTTGAEKIEIPATFLGTKIEDMSNTLTLNIPDKLNSDDPQITALVKPAGGGDPAMRPLSMHSTTGQDELANVLRMYMKQNPELKVIIRAKADLDWRFIQPVVIDCNEAAVRSINYDTSQAK